MIPDRIINETNKKIFNREIKTYIVQLEDIDKLFLILK